MKNKILSAILGFAMLLGIASCGSSLTSSGPEVNIKRLSAQLSTTEPATANINGLAPLRANDGSSESTGETSTTEEDDIISQLDAQYIVIYKSELDIDFKVELDNPQFSEITAIKFACDDPNATVAVENSKGETTWNSIKDYPIVKWGGTDMYKRTFEIKLSEGFTSDECALSVLDLQVNNEWQNKKLNNDVLDIYRMEDTDLQWNFIKNSTEYYEWEFIHSEKVSNIEVEGIEKDENGHYKATKDGKIKYTWDYTNGNKSIKYARSKDIEILKVWKTCENREDIVLSKSINFGFSGTGTEDIKEVELYSFDGEEYIYVATLDHHAGDTQWINYNLSPNLLVLFEYNRSTGTFSKIVYVKLCNSYINIFEIE